MSYSNPNVITYGLGLQAFTSAIAIKVVPPLRHNRGVILDISCAVTILFTAVSTPAYVRVGTDADPDKYAELNMGTAASGSAYNSRDFPRAILSDIDLARDEVSDVRIATIAPTGGTPAGSAHVWIPIAWS